MPQVHCRLYLNSGLMASGFISSTILSRVGIQLGAKWQFCSTTQQPEAWASAMSAAALGPWPWPREMAENRLDMPLSAAAAAQHSTVLKLRVEEDRAADRLAGLLV